MQRLEVSGAVQPIYGSLGVKQLTTPCPPIFQAMNKEKFFSCILMKNNWRMWNI